MRFIQKYTDSILKILFKILLYTLILLFNITVRGQSAGDYRSKSTGNWGDATTWETYNGSAWVDASSAPNSTNGAITIQGHAITITADVTIDQVILNSGSVLTINTGTTFTIADGSGTDFNETNSAITVNGTLIINAGALATGGGGNGGRAGSLTISSTGTLTLNGTINGVSTVPWTTLVNFGGLMTISSTGVFSVYAGSQLDKLSISGTVVVNDGGTIAVPTSARLTINSGGTLVLEPTTFVSGNSFVLSSGGNLEISSTAGITSSGATGNVQTSSRTYNAAAKYRYNGTAAQVTGNGFPTNLTGTLTINNSSGVTLSASRTISTGTLNLTTGNLITTSTNLLTIGAAGTTTGASSSSFVDGPLAQTIAAIGPTAKTFPIGKGTAYRLVDLTITQDAATSTIYTAEVFNSAPTTRTLPGTIDLVSTVRYWNVTKGSGANVTNASITLNYNTDDGVTETANLRIAKDNGAGAWVDLGGTGSGSPSGSISSTTNFTTFSDFVLANATGGTNPLPVVISSFSASIVGSSVKLSWRTETEVNNYGFEIERAQGDSNFEFRISNFEMIGFVKGHGNSNSPKDYSFFDEGIISRKYFYRLKQIDTDGKFEYSKAIEVDLGSPGKFELSQNYPNPFNPTTKIDYQLPFESLVRMELYSITGERIAELINSEQAPGYYTVELNSARLQLSSGVYIYSMKAMSKMDFKSNIQLKKMVVLK